MRQKKKVKNKSKYGIKLSGRKSRKSQQSRDLGLPSPEVATNEQIKFSTLFVKICYKLKIFLSPSL